MQHFINGNGNVGDTSDTHSSDDMIDRDLKLMISKLEKDKHGLQEELDVFKAPFKKLLELLSDTERKLSLV